MGYISDNLLSDEKIGYIGKLHWIIFLWPCIFIVIALLLFSGGKESAQGGIGFLIIGILLGVFRYITYSTSEFGITNKRVIIKVGFIRRRTLEMLLPKIETVGINQGILARMLNYGTIVVVGSGGTREPFKKISEPLQFRQKVLNEIVNVGKDKS